MSRLAKAGLIVLCLAVIVVSLVAYWRYVYFFRDPERTTPQGRYIISPADGTVAYLRPFTNGQIPPSNKLGEMIDIEEITKGEKSVIQDGYLIGIFMSPFDVHVNRAPVAGRVMQISHFEHDNVLLIKMWGRIVLEKLRLAPLRDQFSRYPHILENERNTVLIQGEFPVYVIQIADKTVNKVVTWVEPGEELSGGQRFGMIRMGSQVDIIFPDSGDLELRVQVGQHVLAGETILAEY